MIHKCVRCASEGEGICECGGTRLRVLETPEETIARLTRERDEARAAVATYEEQIAPALAAVTRERDEARGLLGLAAERAEDAEVEVERLKRERNQAVESAGEAEREVERLRAMLQRFAAHRLRERGSADHACKRCFPEGGSVKSGFTCLWHEAIDHFAVSWGEGGEGERQGRCIVDGCEDPRTHGYMCEEHATSPERWG